jgi:hypothetical protein
MSRGSLSLHFPSAPSSNCQNWHSLRRQKKEFPALAILYPWGSEKVQSPRSPSSSAYEQSDNGVGVSQRSAATAGCKKHVVRGGAWLCHLHVCVCVCVRRRFWRQRAAAVDKAPFLLLLDKGVDGDIWRWWTTHGPQNAPRQLFALCHSTYLGKRR